MTEVTENKEYLGWLSKINQFVVKLLLFTLIWSLVSLLFLGYLWIRMGLYPRTSLGWLLALAFGPIVFVLFKFFIKLYAECVGRIPFIKKLRDDIDKKTEKKTISGVRITYLLPEFLFFGAVLFGAAYGIYTLGGDTFEPLVRL